MSARPRPGAPLLILVLLAGTPWGGQPARAAAIPDGSVGDPGTLTWREDPAPAAVLAPATGPALVYFTAAWCGPCKLFAREVLTHPQGRAELAHYRRYQLDLDHPHGQALADTFRVSTVPTFVLLDAAGQEIDRIRGYRSRRLLLHDLARFRRGEGTRAALRAALARRPGDPVLQARLGLRELARLDLDAAADLLAAGLAGEPALPDTLAGEAARALADVHRRQDRPAAAAAVLEDLLARWPAHPYSRVTWQQLADHRERLGDPRGALAALERAAAVEPVRADHLVTFARAAAAQSRRLEAAEAAARRAVDLTGRADPGALAALAQVLRQRRQYPEAMVWIKRAVAAAPVAERARWREEREGIWRAAVRGEDPLDAREPDGQKGPAGARGSGR